MSRPFGSISTLVFEQYRLSKRLSGSGGSIGPAVFYQWVPSSLNATARSQTSPYDV